MLAMVLFGLGEVLGCFFIGFFIDRLGSRIAAVINILMQVVVFAFTLSFIGVYKFNALAFLMCFFWGFQDSAINTHTQEILGFEFDDNYTPFSLYNIWQSVSCFAFQLVIKEVNGQYQNLYFTICMAILAIVGCGLTYFFPFREEKANSISLRTLVSNKIMLRERNAGDTSMSRKINGGESIL